MTNVVHWLNDTLKDIKHEKFKDVVNIEDAESEPTGDGQVVVISDIKRVTLTLVKPGGHKEKLKIIAKLEALTGPGRDFAALCDAFVTEITIYNDVLKKMEKLMSEVGDDEYLWAHCYHTGENKLIFQDLCEVGYKVVPTHKFLDLDHSLLVMKAVGKFHALTMVMKERCLLDTSLFKMPYYARRVPLMDVMQLGILKKLAKSMKENWGPNWAAASEKLLQYFEKPGEVLHDAWAASQNKWDVLNHGDFSMRNMLFHYHSDSTKPDAIKFVDFQMCHYGNLANDLIMLIYSSIRPQLREANMKRLLDTYVDSLTTTAERFELKGPLPTLHDVESSIGSMAPLVITQFLFNVPMFVMSGKLDLQEKADEYFKEYDSTEKALQQGPEQGLGHLDFEDKDVMELLKFDLQRCLDENLL